MKNDLPYFSHDNNASQHPKMKALIAQYGFEGYGRFWALNERIAQSNAKLDISRKVYKLSLADELKLTNTELDEFINFLADSEIDLINYENGIITTDRITENYEFLMCKREKDRERGKGKNEEEAESKKNPDGKSQNPDGKSQNPAENEKIQTEKGAKESKVKESKVNKTSGSAEPFSVSENPLKAKENAVADMTEPIKLANLFLTSHRKEFPDYLCGKDTKNITDKWAQDIEKLIRIDKKPPETIRLVILWVKTPGNFWFHNIESGKKLREKFERLYGEMQTRKTGPPKKERNSYIADAEQSDRLIEEMNRAKEQAFMGGDLSGELKKIARGCKC
jgi:hypothetical protein